MTAEQINAEYQKARTAIVDSANHILRIGQLLSVVKDQLPHGQFIPWVEDNCEFSRRAASAMMKSFRKWELTSHLTEDDAIQISRDTWGNKPKPVAATTHHADDESDPASNRSQPKTDAESNAGEPPASAPEVVSTEEGMRDLPPPPTQAQVDLREIHAAGAVFADFARNHEPGHTLERFGAVGLGDDVMRCAQWFADLWHLHRGEVDVSIPLQGGKFYHPLVVDVERWVKAYPEIDVMAELRKCAAWNDANPGKRKTHKGIKRHIVMWLGSDKRNASSGEENPEHRAVAL